MFGGFQLQEASGKIEGGQLNPEAPRCTPQPVQCEISDQIQPSSEGDDDILAVRLGLSLEIMTPRLAEVPGDPRLFVHVDPIYVEGFERNIAGTGNPGPMTESFLPPPVTRSDENVYNGQGTRIFAEVSPLVVGAGIGVALSFEILEHTVRVRPSAEYLTERLSVTGQMNRVVQVAQNPRPRTPSDFRFIALRDVDRKRYHAVGAGLDVELDADRLGPIVLTPFMGARAFHFLGDLDVDLSDTNEFGEMAEWHFEREEWQWEARLGIRLRWLPR
jgi:hypothetical protein